MIKSVAPTAQLTEVPPVERLLILATLSSRAAESSVCSALISQVLANPVAGAAEGVKVSVASVSVAPWGIFKSVKRSAIIWSSPSVAVPEPAIVIRSSGASASLSSNTFSSRLPELFSNLKNISWPDAQSARSTISWTMVAISGLVITCPTLEAGIPFQSTEALVAPRLVISKVLELAKNKLLGAEIAAASPTSWPTIVVFVVLVWRRSMVKSIKASSIVTPWDTVIPVKRKPKSTQLIIKFGSKETILPEETPKQPPSSSKESSVPSVIGKVWVPPTTDCVPPKSKASSVASVSEISPVVITSSPSSKSLSKKAVLTISVTVFWPLSPTTSLTSPSI